MKRNMGNLDRIIRLLIAVVAAYLFFANKVDGTLKWIVLIVGVIMLLTSLINFCPLYRLFGIRTCPAK